MTFDVLQLPVWGLFELPLWGYVLIVLGVTHISIASITIFLHRHQAHRALELHPLISHFFRFWLWLSTGTITKEWVSVHRQHHAKVETEDDPHSPVIYGIGKVLLEGYELYRKVALNGETMKKYGYATPDDWLERNIYTPFSVAGLVVLFFANLVLFGAPGIVMWVAQLLWQPVFAAGIINGMGHWWGYRNFEVTDASTNIVPWGIFIGGEELHNNHHAFPSSAKLSNRWWEVDIGWMYIRTLEVLGLAEVKKVSPRAKMDPDKVSPDLDTLRAVLQNRFQVMSRYAKTVLSRVHAEELRQGDAMRRSALKRVRSLLVREETLLSNDARSRLDIALAESHALTTVYEYKRRLQNIWQVRSMSQERLVQALEDWCKQAEASGIRALQDFAKTLPTYSVAVS